MNTPLSRLLIIIVVAVVAGCSTPIGVRQLAPREAYLASRSGPLGAGQPSPATLTILNRVHLSETFAASPDTALAALHDLATRDHRRDIFLALAELAYLAGEQAPTPPTDKGFSQADYFLLAALYAYYAVLDTSLMPRPNLFDPAIQAAGDLYNYALWRGLATGPNGDIELNGGLRRLPIGDLTLTLDPARFPWDLDRFERFAAADGLAVRGLSVRNRRDGLGAPLIAVRRAEKDNIFGRQAIPASVFLRLPAQLPQPGQQAFTATIELHSAYADAEVEVSGVKVPLETDTSVATAYKLAEEEIWHFGVDAFLGRLQDVPSKLFRFQPYDPDRIPVIFVHGTMSSPVWWAETINSLSADPVLGEKYQFWYFFYNSSRLITISALDLRRAITEQITKLDPDHRSPAMAKMVVIGHSQGGLLAKLTAIDSGDQLLKTVIDGRLEDLDTSEKSRQLIRDNMLISHVPAVQRVVFIATPHRGSYLSESLVRNLVHRFIELPVSLVTGLGGIYGLLSDRVKSHWQGEIPTSVDTMSPDDPLLNAIASLPLANGVKGHSIIAVKDPGENPEDGDDGVVTYRSAHLEGMESELIVNSSHSCQDKPVTIEELRRILLDHLDAANNPPILTSRSH